MGKQIIFTGECDGVQMIVETFSTSNSIAIITEEHTSGNVSSTIELDIETAKDFLIELQAEVKILERRLEDE